MNNIKLFMLLIMAATSSVAIADGGTWNFSESNGTLTINASGDLTTASQSTTYKVFTNSAVDKVFTSENSSYTSVTQGANYIATDTYYEPIRTWTKIYDGTGTLTVDYDHIESVTQTSTWNSDVCNVDGTYIYPALLGTVWNVPDGTYLYSVGGTPKADVWSSTALASNKLYKVSYSSQNWDDTKTSGKYIYKVQKDWENKIKVSPTKQVTGVEDGVSFLTSTSDIQQYQNFYIYTETAVTEEIDITSTVGNEVYKFVPSDWKSDSPCITITEQQQATNNGEEITYEEPKTFTYNNTTYYLCVVSNSELTIGSTYNLSSLSTSSTPALITDMSSYHTAGTRVNIRQVNQYVNDNLDLTTIEYNSNTYYKYVTSNTQLTTGWVDISTLSIMEETDANKATLEGYSSTKKITIENWNANRVTGGTYTASTTTYGDEIFVGYVKLSSTYDSNATYYSTTDGLVIITESNVDNYVNHEIKYTAGSNLYLSSGESGEKTLLTSSTEYTYESGQVLWTPSGTTYAAIADNGTYFGTGGTGESYITDHTENLTFKEALRQQILSGSYTKVVFNNTASGELTINSEIVHAILYPNIASQNQKANGTIEELDMGKATMISLNSEDMSDYDSNLGSVSIFEDFLLYPDMYYVTPENLEKVTLPLVRKNDEEMVLPSLNANIPSSVKTVTVPDGYTKVGEFAFLGCSDVTHVNLPENLTEIGDYSFYLCAALAEINITNAEVAGRKIVLPSTVQTIGDSAFKDDTKLVSTKADPFILPASLVTIEACAFADLTELLYLELNKSLEFVGNSAFFCSSALKEQTTITFPKSIKYLGPGSFLNRWYSDIYFTGTKAPISPLGNCDSRVNSDGQTNDQTAFSGNIQYGNNGFNPYLIEGSSADNASQNGYANRENYMNNDAYYFTMLHFPDSLTTAQLNTYRAADRVYITANVNDGVYQFKGYGSTLTGEEGYPMTASYFKESDATNLTYQGPHGGARWPEIGVLTAKTVNPGYVDTYQGLQRIWPSQAQWMRYFALAANGYQWDGTTPYQPTVTDDMLELMEKDGLKVYNVTETYGSANAANDVAITKSGWSSLSSEQQEYLSKILYQGTRRFVLSYDGGFDIPFKVKLKGGRWWSICLPFNMTKAEVDRVFGNGNTGTHVCLMSAVDRTVTNNSTDGNTLVLKFKNDVYRHRTVRTTSKSTTTNEEEEGSGLVYTYASNFSKSNTAPADDDIVIYARESYMIYPVREDEGTDPVYYDFGTPVFETGNPLPTIVYSNSDAPYTTQNGEYPAYRFIGNFTTSTGNDGEGNAITIKIPQYSYAYGRENAQATQSKFFILSSAGATWSPFKSLVQNTAVGGGLNDWNNFFQQNTARVNQVSLFGDDEEVTGIDNVIIEVSSDNDEDLRVFNLNGSMMGNSLQGLPAGTYIQGGKAYRVK